MFLHNLKYTLKIIFKNKGLVFWTFLFPLVLSTLFNLAFKDIGKSAKLELIKIGIINDNNFKSNIVLKESFESLSDKNNKDRLFITKYVTEEKAKKLLQDDKIVGYLKVENDKPKIYIKTSGSDQTIFKYVTEEIIEKEEIITNISEKSIRSEIEKGNASVNYNEIVNNSIEKAQKEYKGLNNIFENDYDFAMIEFYTLIAMTCMYGGLLSMFVMNQNLPNMSERGKRVAISPTKKRITIISSLIGTYIVQIIGLTLLFLYTIFVLKVDYGSNFIGVVSISLAGMLAGLSLGVLLASCLKKNEGTKTGILIAVTMFGCALAGMFGGGTKYIIDKNIPILNMINPVSLITDGLYRLYYYSSLNYYYKDLFILVLLSVIMMIISLIFLRRNKYDSI